MRQIFVINGFPGSGKTTFGGFVAEEMKRRGIPFQHISSIDPIKSILRNLKEHSSSLVNADYYQKLLDLKQSLTNGADWDGVTKDEYWRGVMAEFKTQVVVQLPGIIEKYLATEITKLPIDSCIFVDIREPKGIIAMEEYLSRNYSAESIPEISFRTVLIKSDSETPFENIADNGVLQYNNYDIIIRNDRIGKDVATTLAELRQKAIEFCNEQFPDRSGRGSSG